MISAPIPKADPQKWDEAENIKSALNYIYHWPSEDELKTAAQLAQEGYLSSVKNLRIEDRNISEISSDNMSKLVSIITGFVWIENMTPLSQLGIILASVQSRVLHLVDMSLSEGNTRSLVTAMRTRVQKVWLGRNVTFDPELLSAYDGQGHCTELKLEDDTRDKYEERLREWAGDRGWRVTQDTTSRLVMQSPTGIHILYYVHGFHV